MVARDGFRVGIRNFARLSRHEKNWVTSEIIRELSLHERSALDDFIRSMRSAQIALRGGVSVFMSHSSRDKRFVRPLAEHLETHGIHVWLDEADLFAGQSLLRRLSDAVNDTRFLIAVLSNHSVKSPWVQKELSLAIDQEVSGGEIKVIPIVKDNCKIPAFITDKLYLDFRHTAARQRNRPVLVDTIMQLAADSQGLRL